MAMFAVWNKTQDTDSDESADKVPTQSEINIQTPISSHNKDQHVHAHLSTRRSHLINSGRDNRDVHRQRSIPRRCNNPAAANHSMFPPAEVLRNDRRQGRNSNKYIPPSEALNDDSRQGRNKNKVSKPTQNTYMKPRFPNRGYSPTARNEAAREGDVRAAGVLNISNKNRTKMHNIVQQAEAYELPRTITQKQNMRHSDPNLVHGKQLETGSERKVGILGWKKLNELVEKTSNEIVLSLILPTSGLKEFLEKGSGDKRDLIAVFLIVLSKCCDSLLKGNLLSLLALVTQSKNFMYCELLRYLVGFQNSQNDERHLQSLHALLKFLDTFQNSLPASASDLVPVLLLHLKQACCTVFSEPELQNVKEKIQELEEQQQRFVKDHTKVEIKKAATGEDVQTQQPPENYRQIPILPSIKDVTEITPFLRPNVVEGKYLDGEHYLDVQFRLLREDYIRPLREGIAAYKRFKGQEKSTSKNKDVRIYEDVHITHQEFLHGSLIHVGIFDPKKFAHVNWEHSKRFLTGSLLCFSSNDFDTFLFASVANRDCEKLKKGILILKFEEISTEVLNISPVQNFVMLETTAYFEAYRHNLAALHDMTGDGFPFEKYIVSINADVSSPPYLSKATTYDIGQLFRAVERDYLLTNVPKINMNVLDELFWPSYKELGFDLSQFKAFQTAITKELAIIQGPPGTGKTYVGLRIVQLLLHNSSKWNTSTDLPSPILIVCYTNHALDQFLEGIESFTTEIVRVGGRCTNATIEKYKLSKKKQTVRERREVPHHIFSNVRHQYTVLDQLKNDINRIMSDIKKAHSSLLADFELGLVMKDNHYTSLKHVLVNTRQIDDDFIISNWLDIRSQGSENELGFNAMLLEDAQHVNIPQPLAQEMGNPQVALNSNPGNDIVDAPGESDEEDDIDFIEGMRDVDTEDFSQFHVNFGMHGSQNVHDLNWQIQGGQQNKKQFIAAQLEDVIPFSETEVDPIKDVWRLDMKNRWRLYKYLVQKYVREKQVKLVDLQSEIQKEFKKLNEMRTEEDLYLMKKARIVAMTTTGAAKYRDLVRNIKPKIVVIEEAAEILECHIITTLVQETQHLILIGDHQQLRPNPNVYELAVRYNLNVSLFERLVKNGMGFCRLTSQHRMRPAIAELLVPHIYPDLSNHESVLNLEDIKGVAKNVFFISHSFIEGNERDSASRVNDHEARFIVKLCKYFLLQGYESSQITILTTYSGQLFLLKRLGKLDLLQGVRITVVDNFQGEENDIILISFVRSNLDGSIGFLKVSNRVCVALSRAKKGLFCIGNFDLLAQNSSVWENIITTLKGQGAIGESLRLQCQNHPNVITEVSSEQDFHKVPEGGCMLPCEYRLTCGHTCSRTCHSYDPEHENFQCKKICGKPLCQLDHKCQKYCFRECGPCSQKILKTLPGCQHETLVPCNVSPSDFSCLEPCQKLLPCNHYCKRLCGQMCLPETCEEKVEIKLLCNHKQIVLCSQSHTMDELLEYCKEPCGTLLDCGHMCVGTCGECHQKRVHKTCRNRCNRILVCGHECKSPCSRFCPPCKQKCENRCQHSKCPKKCGEPCETCKEPCPWSCEHMKCEKLCGEICSRLPCDHPCNKTLKCAHPCIGLCAEPCPKLCAICNPEIKQEIFFGTEDEEDARFVQLEDCGHILEVKGLTHWMSKPLESGEIRMKCCPRCNTVIRKNLRFGNIVKTCLSSVEQVKKVIYGDKEKNEIHKVLLLGKINSLKFSYKAKELLNSLAECLEKRKSISGPFIITCENIFNISQEFLVIQREIYDMISYSDVEKLLDFATSTENLISDFIKREYLTASSQQIQEITRELLRYKAQARIFKFFNRNSILFEGSALTGLKKKNLRPGLQELVSYVTKLCPFKDTDEQQFERCFKEMVQMCGSAVINVTAEEKKLILKAMNLSQGHWYQCPNGHVYCITECGGATVESKCSECGAKIGGGSHTLRSDNRVATDMDGSRHPAWSETANMQNYNLE